MPAFLLTFVFAIFNLHCFFCFVFYIFSLTWQPPPPIPNFLSWYSWGWCSPIAGTRYWGDAFVSSTAVSQPPRPSDARETECSGLDVEGTGRSLVMPVSQPGIAGTLNLREELFPAIHCTTENRKLEEQWEQNRGRERHASTYRKTKEGNENKVERAADQKDKSEGNEERLKDATFASSEFRKKKLSVSVDNQAQTESADFSPHFLSWF